MKPTMLHRAALACLMSTSLACDYFAPIEPPDALPDASDRGQRDVGVDGDAGVADILVDATGATVSESGDSITLSFALSQRPTSLVLLTASVSDEDEIELDPESLTFTPDLWQQDLTIVVRGIDDLEADGESLVTVSFAPVVSDDPAYSGLQLSPVELINEDGVCGNDVVDGQEECDPPDPDACAQASGDCTLCNASCREQVVEGGPRCGDGVVNQVSETCDAPGQPTLCPNGRAVVTCQDGCTLPASGCEPRVDVGEHGGCYIEDDGTLTCWGFDFEGVASPPGDLEDVAQVAVAGGSGCALLDSGAVTCWGAASGLPTDDLRSFVLTQIDVSASPAHLCGVDDTNTVRCIGENGDQQTNAPTDTFAQVEVSGQGSCGVTLDHELICWGAGASEAPSSNSQEFVYVSGGGGSWCALTIDGKIECWGADVDEELFTRDDFLDVDFGARSVCGVYGSSGQGGGVECVDFDSASWVPASSTAGFGELPSISVGKRSVCFIDDGALACTQSDVHLGHAGVELVALEAHKGCVCGVMSSGRVRCAGTPEFCPVEALNALQAEDLALKADGGCVIEQGSNDVSCWQVDPNGAPTSLIPIGVVGTPEVVEVAGSYGCAIDDLDKVTCWRGRTILPGPSEDFLGVSIGAGFACGIVDTQAGQTVSCWSLVGGAVPIVPSGRTIRDVEVVGSSGCFLDTMGNMSCFGTLDPSYTSPSAPSDLLSTGKSLCLIESQTDFPFCYVTSPPISTRFGGVPVDLFALTETTSYAVPRGGALVWRED